MKKVNMRKLRDELVMVVVIVAGIALMVMNFFKIVPPLDSVVGLAFAELIAWGFPIGLVLAFFGAVSLWEIVNTPYTRKRKGTCK